ncbi:MAG: response regulator [Acetatifactor sp.]
MNTFVTRILFVGGIYALYAAIKIRLSTDWKSSANKLFALQCVGSGIWSLGFGELFAQTDPAAAYYCRSIGLAGTFIYLLSAQLLVCYISGIPKHVRYILQGFASLGIPVFFLIIQRDQTVYYMSDQGMTYYFKPGLANNLYTAYSVMFGIVSLSLTIYMIHFGRAKRIKALGKRLLIVTALMIFGTVLDTVLPLLGLFAIPGSTLMQLLGTLVLYYALRADNRAKINVENMSSYIYYSLSMPVLVYDSRRVLQIINDSAADFFELEQSALSQTPCALHQLFELKEQEAYCFEQNHQEMDVLCTRNQIICNLSINKIHDRYGDIMGYIIIVTDLSERMKNIQHLEEAKKEAEAANMAKSTFLASMSHEIRTPMNAILGFSELILKQKISAVVRDYVSDIKLSCQNLLAVVNDILDISKLESGKMELVEADYYTNSLYQDVYHIISIQAKKKGLRFVMEVDPSLPSMLYGDKTRIRSILINVLNNAVKYTREGGVTCLVKILNREQDNITLQFIVADTGIGIKESAMAHLFESFSQFDQKKNKDIEGTGLGLAIVHGYLNLMGGTVDVNSTYGKGSTFTIVFPQRIVDATPMEEFTANSSDQASALNANELKIRDTDVLIVDDNLINLKVITGTFECYGLHVTTASSGSQAIELCRQKDYDLVFMDQMMPGMDGIEAMRRIRGLSAHYATGGRAKIIVLTANAIAGTREKLMEEGFDEYLSKPMSFAKLENLLTSFVPAEKCIYGRADENEFSAVAQDSLGSEEMIGYVAGDGMRDSADGDGPNDSVAGDGMRDSADTRELIAEYIPELDYALGVERCGGNEDTYLEILQLQIDLGKEHPSQLRALFAEERFDDFRILIHGIKGQLNSIGYTRLGSFAEKLEHTSRDNEYDFVRVHLPLFLEKYGELIRQLETVLQR